MCSVTFRLLQSPQVLINNQIVTFPFKKAEALVYYLAVRKSVSREEAASFLWFDDDEVTARKNLRHALYIIKKSCGLDLIVSPRKHTLNLNPDLSITSDYDQFIKNGDAGAYQGEFLEGFYVKNADEFESWISLERTSLRDSYLRLLYNDICTLPIQKLPVIEEKFNRYIEIDPLDERVYYQMMLAYQKANLYHKGIKVYQTLYKLLNMELHVSPNKDIVRLHKDLLNSWTESAAQETTADHDYLVNGREKEVQILQNSYHQFLGGTPTVIILTGENGVGKTYLLQRFLDSLDYDSTLILRAICFKEEESFSLQPWNTMILQLDRYLSKKKLRVPEKYIAIINHIFPLFQNHDLLLSMPEDVNISYNLRAIRNTFLKLFQLVGEEIPLILAFDNLQHMDDLSLELLSLLIREQNPNIMVIGTMTRDPHKPYLRFVSPLEKEHMLTYLPVQPFTRKETEIFVQKQLNLTGIPALAIDTIYQETAGNAYFLELLINGLSRDDLQEGTLPSLRLQDMLSEQLSQLNRESRQILDMISLFQDAAALDVLEYILNKDNLELLSILDDLKKSHLIRESVQEGVIYISFRHNTMRDFVYGQLSPSKIRILHNRVASYYEDISNQSQGWLWYQNLIYHYRMCQNEPKVLQYRILELEKYSNLHYELYPILPPPDSATWEAPEGLSGLLKELADELYALYRTAPNAIDYQQYEARLLHLTAKYDIAQGNYEDGLPLIDKLISAIEYVADNPSFQIQCLRQMTFYGIQTWNTDLMKQQITRCMSIAREYRLSTDLAIEHRLSGLMHSMTGDYETARQLLQTAITIFQSSSLRAQSFSLNIAACYHYLGEVAYRQKSYEEALDYYRQAISTCMQGQCAVNATFYVNMALTLFALKKEEKAMNVFSVANSIYDDTHTLMGRSTARAAKAILLAENEQISEARLALKEADECAHRLRSPRETGILCLAKAYLAKRFPSYFTGILTEPPKVYNERAIALLRKLPNNNPFL